MVNDVVLLNAKETPLRGKPKSGHLVFSFVNDSLFWWSMASRICDVTLETKSEKRRPYEPRHRWSVESPYVRGRMIACILQCATQHDNCAAINACYVT